MTNFVKFRKNNLTRRKGILSFVVAFTLLLTYLLTASRPVFAGGFPNDAKGISGNGKYYSLGQIEKLYSNQFATYNNLTVITSDTHENSDNFAFCLANGKRFPSFTDEKPKGIYTLVKDINKEQYTKLLKENHKWSSIPNLNQAWDTFSRLSYMYLKDPTDIVKRAWGTDLNTARTYFHQVIQYEIWRYTDGMRVSSDTNVYIYEKFSPQQKKALEMIRTDLYNFTVPYENLEYRFYKPDWVFGLGFQALATVRWKIEPATITVTKKWENVKEGAEKPEVWIQLLKDDKPEGDRKRIEPDKGRTTFEIPNKDEINKYSVKEVDKEGRDWKHKDFTAGQPVNKGNGHFEITNTKKEKPKIKVTFKKIAGDTNKDLAGAHLVLKKIFDDGNGLLIKQWDTIGQPVDIDLDAGSYTLTEEKAPDGYMLAAPVSFYVEEDGQIILPKGEDLEAQNDKTITMVDEKIKEKPTKPSGKLATTVEVDGTKADAQKELELSVATDKVTKTVKDTVVYENLLAGETYKLTGQLMKITADKEEEVATKETTFVADASGNGTTSLEFEDVSLEAGVKYVVYETAESEKEIDFKEGKEKHKVEHKDKDDKAQTVVVTKEKPTKPSGKLATTVEVDGTKADAQKELELSVATDKVTKTVKDTVVYENLLAGETYKLTGQLMKITADKEEEVATKETTFVADASGNGTTSLEFEDVSLEAGVKYVVYETAESEKEIDFKEGKEKHKVEHKDKDDKAQTVVVSKIKPEPGAQEVHFSKVNVGGEEIAGAEIHIKQGDTVVASWVSEAGKTHTLKLKPGHYIFHEAVAPGGYLAVTDIHFSVDETGQVTVTDVNGNTAVAEGNKLTVTDQTKPVTPPSPEEPGAQEVHFSKVNVGGEEIAGAEIHIKQGDTVVASWVSEAGKTHTLKLKPGHYIFHEAVAPGGYLAVTDIHFSVDETGQVTVTDVNGNTAVAEGNKLTVTDQTKPVTPPSPEEPGAQEVHFSKVNVGGEEIAGAEIHIKQGDTVVASWVSEAGKTHTLKLKPGHYIFHEAVAPGGYLAVTDIHFSVDETGQVTVTDVNGNTAVAEGNKLTVTDQTKPVTPPSPEEPGAQEVHFSKVNVGGEEIAGAEIHIKQGDTVVASWVSEAGKTHTLKLKPGHYIFHEAVAPGGYLAVTDIHFSVDETGQVTVTDVNGNTAVAEGNKLTVTDQTKPVTPPSPEEPGAQEVHFSKVNVGGEEIAGAEIHIKQGDTVVASWVSEAGKTHTLKLKPGHYIFHEAVAPGGYLAVTDIHFSVDETGQVTVTDVNGNTAVAEGNKLTVTDQTKPVTPPSPEEPGAQEVHFSKVNVGGEEIAGAEIHIKQGDTVVASWVSEAGKTHTLKLKPGHYIFHEAVAPGGYLAVTDIHFSVDETGQVTVTDVNGNTAVAEGNKLTVTDQTKPVTPPSPEEPGAQEVHFSKVNVGGEEIAGAEIHIKQGDTVVASWVSEAGKTHTLKLKPGHYIFHEAVAPGGYLAVTDIHFSVDETGQVTVTDVNGNTAVAEGNKLTVTDQTKPVTPPSPEEPGAQEVHFSKVNVGGEEIAGAEIHIKQGDTVVASWVSEAGKTHTLKLKPGHYIFHEAVAPGGYLAVTDIHFSVDETGQVTVTDVNGNTAVAEGNKLTVTDQTKPVTPPSPEEPGAQEVHFSKVNVGGEEIAGAEIHIKQGDTVVASWVSEAGKTHTLKLKPGHYIFHEAVAPGGYLAVTDIHFSVDETGQVTVTDVNGNTAVAEGNKLTVTDQTKPVTPPSPEEPGAQEVHFSKVNVGGEEIAGAEIHIKQGDTVVASWVSEAGKTHTLKLKPGHYIFHEAVAPGGYLAVTDIHFSVDETGQVTVTDVNGNTAVAEGNKLTVTDQTKPVTPPSPEEPGAQEVHFSKVNVGGEEIAGAEIHIKQGDTVVASWVSEAGKTHTLKLKPGHYIFHEAVAPGGYLAVTDIHFSVDETGQVTVTDVNGNTAVAEGNKLTVTDQTKPVTPPSPEEPGAQEVHFSKVNVGGEEIAGAEIHIKQGDTVVASWVSEAGKTHTLKLKPGHYIFHEAVAPGGYLAVTDIHFSVDETGQVTVTDVNGNTAVAEGNKLTVTDQTKPVTPPSPEEPGAQEVHFSKVNVGGEEIAGAEIHIKQGDTVVASWVSEAGKTHTLKLKPGHYIFHEAVAPGGYLAVTDIHFSVDETGQVTVTDVNGNTAVAEGNKLTVTDQTKPVTPPSPEEPGAQEVHFSKVNVGGEEIAGAEIHIKQGDTVVASWVSEAGKTHTLKLKPGHYIFHEAVAPGGYLAVTDIHFSVDETGQVTVTDVNGNTAVAEGNKLTVTDQSADKDKQDKLPNTGETTGTYLSILGMITAVFASLLYRSKKK
ncbi:SpaA isopeptide-forming pilin-related protein [Streptococcus pneumoniae]